MRILRPGLAGDAEEPTAVAEDVTAELAPMAVQRVAREYLVTNNSSVALYTRKAGAEPEDPELAELDPASRARVKQMLSRLSQQNDPAQLEQRVMMMEAMMSQVPPEDQPAMEYLVRKIHERIEELQAAGDD